MSLSITDVRPAGAHRVVAPNHRMRVVMEPDDLSDHSPFLMMAEDWFSPPAGFPMHPHRGMETVTFVLDGKLLHKDHTGGFGELGADAAAFMTAGGGVMHSEMPGPDGVHTLQLWLNLPAAMKRVPANYSDVDRKAAAVHRAQGVEARVYAGRLGDAAVLHGTTWPITLIDVKLEASTHFDLALPTGERVFAYILSGEVVVGSNKRTVKAGEIAWAQPAKLIQDSGALSIKCAEASRLLVYASPIFDEPIAMGGPFVMNTDTEIAEAFADLRAGRLVAANLGRSGA